MAAGLNRRSLALNDREQRYAILGAWLGAAVSVALWAPAWDEAAGIALSAIGLGMAGLLALAARRRSRLFTGLASLLLAFGPWGMAWVVGLPYMGLAAWLALKAPRLQPRLDPEVDGHGEIVDATATEEPEEGSAPARRRRWSRRQPAAGEDGGPPPAPRRPPSASKRYTPPQARS